MTRLGIDSGLLGASFSVKRLRRNVVGGLVGVLSAVAVLPVVADQPEVLFVELERRGGTWSAQVTVRHGDTGWEHYADAWRLLDAQGNELGTRTLYHPHENEQPFTRGLSGVVIPAGVAEIDVQAHDKVHGWGAKMRVPLRAGEGEGYRVR